MDTILIIDDEPNIVELARLYMEREGFKVVSASRGRDGLDLIASTNPNLVVLDVMLPDIDGFEVLKRLRKCSKVPVLMLSARREDVDKIVGLEMGADDYLTKPFNPHELLAALKPSFAAAISVCPDRGHRTRQTPDQRRRLRCHGGWN